jgi:hypothetical protein
MLHESDWWLGSVWNEQGGAPLLCWRQVSSVRFLVASAAAFRARVMSEAVDGAALSAVCRDGGVESGGGA